MANVTLNVTDAKGQATGTVEAPEALFGVSAEDVQAHIPLIHQVVTAQLAAARQGTHATKTRGMVSGGGKKPWKQKGTGRARQGSIRAPQWYHGGTVFGPQPRDYSQRTPKKMKAAALRYALSDRVRRIQHPFAIDGFRGLRAAGGAGARRRCFRGRCSGCRTAKYHACSQQHTGSTNNGVFHGCSLLCIDVQQRKPLSEHPSRFCSLKAGLHLLRGTRLSGISQPVFAFKISPKKMRLEPRSTTRKKWVHPMCWDAPLSGQ